MVYYIALVFQLTDIVEMSEAINVLIVEDEWITSEGIKDVLERNELDVVGQYDNAEEALNYVKKEVVDVAILDIKIKGDKDGIWLAEQINGIRPTAIIFLTAFDDEAIVERAKKVVPAAYIIKPFNAKNFIMTIQLAFSNLLKEREGEEIMPKEFMLNDRIFIKESHLLVKILIDDILYVEAVGSYSRIFTKEKNYTLSMNLKTFQSKFNHPGFIRTHRSYLVNSNHIDALNGNQIYLGDITLPVGSSQRAEVIKRLQVI
ncbi:MAG: LytTR family transcriptional regulator DNA-binding domain-containing protein [Ekhidna sp.]|nr:LytTR family transcriptional regulator DNA-binding domain-containing protein [Ekhidna sp.]